LKTISILLQSPETLQSEGIEATQTKRKISPATKILGVSMHIQPSYSRTMIQHGASGYISKDSSLEEMCKAIVAVHNNQRYICDAVKNTIANLVINGNGVETVFNPVSKREMEIIELVRKGYSSSEIAGCLQVGLNSFLNIDISQLPTMKGMISAIAVICTMQCQKEAENTKG